MTKALPLGNAKQRWSPGTTASGGASLRPPGTRCRGDKAAAWNSKAAARNSSALTAALANSFHLDTILKGSKTSRDWQKQS